MNSIHFLLPLSAILVGSQAAGWLSHRLRLPTVFGTLIAGVLLGPSVLGWVASSEILTDLAQIGVLILMFLSGLDTDLTEMRRLGKAAFLTATGGVILPLILGTILAMAFGLALLPSLFAGAILTATSVSITARTLQELGRLHSREGMVILGAAVIDDVLGVLVLSLVIGLSGDGNGLWMILKMLVFLPLAFIVGTLVMPTVSKWIKNWQEHEAGLTIILAVVLLYAWSSEALGGMGAVTGAYLAGLLVGRTEIKERVERGAGTLGHIFFIPLFFASIGLGMHARLIDSLLIFTLCLIVVAIASKGIGCWFGARVGGCNGFESLCIGAGMISRGEVALVIVTLGLQARVIDDNLFSATVVMILATTLLAPVLLRLVYSLKQQVHLANSSGAQFEAIVEE